MKLARDGPDLIAKTFRLPFDSRRGVRLFGNHRLATRHDPSSNHNFWPHHRGRIDQSPIHHGVQAGRIGVIGAEGIGGGISILGRDPAPAGARQAWAAAVRVVRSPGAAAPFPATAERAQVALAPAASLRVAQAVRAAAEQVERPVAAPNYFEARRYLSPIARLRVA